MINNYLSITNPPINPVYLGKIGYPYGLKGWIKIFSFTSNNEDIFNYKPWYLYIKNNWYIPPETNWKIYKNYFLVKYKNINTINIVSLLINSKILINDYQLPPVEKNVFYWKDLIGCTVLTSNNYYLGNVVNFFETGSNDVMIVKNISLKGKNLLIPFILKKIILNINLIKKIIFIKWNINY